MPMIFANTIIMDEMKLSIYDLGWPVVCCFYVSRLGEKRDGNIGLNVAWPTYNGEGHNLKFALLPKIAYFQSTGGCDSAYIMAPPLLLVVSRVFQPFYFAPLGITFQG